MAFYILINCCQKNKTVPLICNLFLQYLERKFCQRNLKLLRVRSSTA